MWYKGLSLQQKFLVRQLLADIPDAEIEAYGTAQQIHEAFDGDADDITEKDKNESRKFVDDVMQEANSFVFQEFYYDLNAREYVIHF